MLISISEHLLKYFLYFNGSNIKIYSYIAHKNEYTKLSVLVYSFRFSVVFAVYIEIFMLKNVDELGTVRKYI